MKTGTLTQNRMIVSHIWANNSVINSENFYRHSDGYKADLDSPAWRALIRIACLCNKAEFSAAQASLPPLKREAIGNSTDVALLKYMEIIIGCVESYRLKYPKIFEILFNSNVRHSLTINKFSGGFWLCMKGAPEVIFDRCSTILVMGKIRPFDHKYKSYFKHILEEFGSFGERVIAFCDTYLPYNEYPTDYTFDYELENYPTKDLRFVGLISLNNPPRASVPDSVHKCRSAGIKIIMITGDHPITAKAIATAVGIIPDDKQTMDENYRFGVRDIHENDEFTSPVITGTQFQRLSDQHLNHILSSDTNIVFARMTPNQNSDTNIVFARMTPNQKLIKCCRNKKSVNAVTGGDVFENADIHIAMGMTGSDMSKQRADIILLDDDFASIVSGIEEGRVIFDNLKKSICYTLSSKTPIICPFLLYLLIDIPLPLGSITILCIDLITDMIPAISLAYEFPEYDIMKYKPRDPIINKLVNKRLLFLSYAQLGVFELFGGLFTYLVIMNENGFNLSYLLGIRKLWDSMAINDLMDSYGQEWTYNRRKALEYTCHTAFFAAVVITKWSALICCKTRRISIIKQKMKNDVLTFSLFFELGLAVFLSYCPGLDRGINLYPLKLYWWFCSIPFAILMIIFDELRRFLLRRYPNGWVENETFY
ncbi:unnamed protein product [Oppiella nova]|uniref:Cation-transporting P-type ATPase C-terminal domain-containing protein n=1 Tax=Oppiella nova TaxID=334625 RepID=A0A7R9LQP7_9ACAR|nr:unnamed protein product [Oppiella nova]CAG2166039.1 unnamed protein product [Oppiella nova]